METNTSKQAQESRGIFCSRYEELLAESQKTLEIWSNRREQAWQMGLRGKELGGELIRLQADFAKSYAALQKHKRECALCEFVAGLVEGSSSGLHATVSYESLPS
jgi:hypothetical protein